jgi:DNA-binding Lrp family transcriptional regulator
VTYKQISEKYNIKVTILTRRVHLLKIRGVFKGRTITFNKKQIKQLLDYDPTAHFKRMSNVNHPRKLAIIEFYEKRKSGRKVAEFMNISRYIVDAAIKEYNTTGFITVESRLNKEEYEPDNVNLI